MLSQKNRQRLLCIAWMVMLCTDLFAQPGDPNNGLRPARKVPIQGIEVILLAGAIWGTKKILDLNRRSANEPD